MTALYNLDYLKELAAGDENFMHEMVKYFYTHTPEVIGQMDALIADDDWMGVRELIHRYIANLNLIGALGVIDKANELEQYAENGEHLDQIPILWQEIKQYCGELILHIEKDFAQIVN